MVEWEGRRVAVVTGSTDGLGEEVARRLGMVGYHVVVHGRDPERGAQVVEAIAKTGGTARFYRADFAVLAEARTLGEALLGDYGSIHLLVNNAGVGPAPDRRMLTKDGHELRFQVNYLAHFLLTRLLLPRLVESAPARIVNVSSGAQNPLDFHNVMLEREFGGWRAYGQSKLAQVMFTFDLAEELEGTNVVVNALHPATFMETTMVTAAGIRPQSTVEEGADAVMRLVTSPDLGSGGFLDRTRPARAHEQAYDMEARRHLRELSRQLTGIQNG